MTQIGTSLRAAWRRGQRQSTPAKSYHSIDYLLWVYYNHKGLGQKDWARGQLKIRGFKFKTFVFLSGSREVIVGFEPREVPRA